MKLTFRHFLGAIIAIIGLTFIFSVPITNYMITSFHPTVEHLKSKPSNVPYDWEVFGSSTYSMLLKHELIPHQFM